MTIASLLAAVGPVLGPFILGMVPSFAAAILPKATEGTAWGYARQILDLVAANWGNATNAK